MTDFLAIVPSLIVLFAVLAVVWLLTFSYRRPPGKH